jgi:hypothetical protein
MTERSGDCGAGEPRERDNVAELTAMFELVIVDECHHIPAVASDQSVEQIPGRRRPARPPSATGEINAMT